MMKNGLVIADAGPIFSLAIIDRLEILDKLFDDIKIPKAVWNEITLIKTTEFYETLEKYFKPKVHTTRDQMNCHLSWIMANRNR